MTIFAMSAFSPPILTFFQFILFIVTLCTYEQMLRIEAGRVIAVVTNKKGTFHFKFKPHMGCKSVNEYTFSFKLNLPVTLSNSSSGPVPATGFFIESHKVNHWMSQSSHERILP